MLEFTIFNIVTAIFATIEIGLIISAIMCLLALKEINWNSHHLIWRDDELMNE